MHDNNIQALVSFGGSEGIAFGINTITSEIIDRTVKHLTWSDFYKGLSIATGGILTEKGGFFAAPYVKAFIKYQLALHSYNNTKHYTSVERPRYQDFMNTKQALQEGKDDLLWDVCIHDPCHTGGVIAGKCLFPSLSGGVISASTFIAALLIVAGLKTGKKQLHYLLLKNGLLKNGFKLEDPYYECRFYLKKAEDPKFSPEEMIGYLNNKFNLGFDNDIHTGHYSDTYLHAIKYSKKLGNNLALQVRLRDRCYDNLLRETNKTAGTKPTQPVCK
ncbi:MAG: hypothetical protein ABIH39_03330 [Candidatus Margulisiibacteriota bacterium]